MNELTEQELLLLSSYMYMDVSVTKGSVGDVLASMQDSQGNFDPARVSAATGGMKQEDVITILHQMSTASDTFKELRVTEVVDTNGIRGACFENAAGEGTVVFRGTGGGYDAWVDNIMGGCQKDTAMQQEAADFIQNQCRCYQNLTVTGHSKGGNMAQYVTVMCGGQVDRCVSYDGQGQSRKFIFSNTQKINEARGKITSISAHNDFVNILLTTIAGRELFVQNQGHGADAHSAVRLLTDNTFDPVTGEFTSLCEQDREICELKAYLANGVILLDELPSGVSEGVYRTLAGILAGVLSSERSPEFELSSIAQHAGHLAGVLGSSASEGFTVNLSVLRQATEELDTGVRSITAVRDTLEGMTGQCDQDLYTRLLVEKVMNRISQRVEKECVGLQRIQAVTEGVLRAYGRGESIISTFIKEAAY